MATMYTYSAIIEGHALTESKNQHTPEVQFRVKTLNCLTTGEPMEKHFFVDLWLTDKCAQKTMDRLRQIGYQSNTLEDLNGDALVGVEVEVSTQFEEYNGSQRERACFINAKGNFSSRGFTKMDITRSKSVTSKYDALLRTTAKCKPPKKVDISRAVENSAVERQFGSLGAEVVDGGNADDDLPF